MIIKIIRNNIYNTNIGTLLFTSKKIITLYGTNEVVPSIEIDTNFSSSIRYKNKRVTLPL
jgi:hypothetical protein